MKLAFAPWAAALLLIAGPAAAKDPAAALKPGETFSDCPYCPTMVVIPAGSNEIGSTPQERLREGVPETFAVQEGPRHAVHIARPFAMSRTEITRSLYARFVTDTQRPDPAACHVSDPKTRTAFTSLLPGHSWRDPGYPQTDDQPAVCISPTDADDFAAWMASKTGLPYRLASEAEWEYAARGGATTTRYWGDSLEPLCANAQVMTTGTVKALGSPDSWKGKAVCDSPRVFTQPVGSFASNPFGLKDMLGNAVEWVADCYHPSLAGAPTDGSAWVTGDCTKRIPKGGALHSLSWLARPAMRACSPANYRGAASGIRLVRDIGPAPRRIKPAPVAAAPDSDVAVCVG